MEFTQQDFPSDSLYHPFHHHQQHQQSWPPYDHPQNYSYAPYPSPSPFPAPRLSPPPFHHSPVNFKSAQNNSPTSSQNQRLTLAGSLNPSTGIFYRTPEHPRLRTAQACEKCRTRKAKCSGEHPACKRCLTRGLICEYAKEGRVRGPNKAKSKPSNSGIDSSTNTLPNIRNGHPRIGPRGRTSSANSSIASSEHNDPPAAKKTSVKHEQEADPRRGLEAVRRKSVPLVNEHRSSRPRPPDLQLGSASAMLYRSSTGDDLDESGFPPFQRYQSQPEYGQLGQPDHVRSMHHPQMSYHQYQFHGDQNNMAAVQAHNQGRSTPSPQRRSHQGMPHTQTDHLMTLGLPYSVSPLQSPTMSEDFMYPHPPSYLPAQHRPFPQYPIGSSTRNSVSATSGSSPGTSTMNSPLTPASVSPFVISSSASHIGMKMDLDTTCIDPALHRSSRGSASIPIEPVWVDHINACAYPQMNPNSEHPNQGADERSRNGIIEGNVFMKNGHIESQQDHFHGQSQFHNETQHHYPTLDLQMC